MPSFMLAGVDLIFLNGYAKKKKMHTKFTIFDFAG